MKYVYCSKCNTSLPVTKRALKNYGVIIDTINPHECPLLPLEFNFKPNVIPMFTDKIVQKSNDLKPQGLETEGLRDRRSSEHIKGDSSAPANLLEQMKRQIDGE